MELGDVAVGRVTYQPGWRWSSDVQPLVHATSCEVHHIGFVVSGRLHVEMTDGTNVVLGPDDAFEIPPGRDAHVAARVMATAAVDEVRISAASASLLDPGEFALLPLARTSSRVSRSRSSCSA